MIIDVDFTESNATFDVDFSEVTQLGNHVLIHKEITENGKYNARDDGATGYSSVNVDVPVPDGYIIPDGEIEITDNGVYDVGTYQNANVDVISGEYDIDAADNGDGTQTLNIVDKDGSGVERYKNEIVDITSKSLTVYTNSDISYVGMYGFASNFSMTDISLPNVESTHIYVFFSCSKLKNVDLPKLSTVMDYTFANCSVLEMLDFSKVTGRIKRYAFSNCTNLSTLILRSETVVVLENSNAFGGTGISKGTGYIYVPDELVEAYKTATNWVTYAEQIKPISELPEEVAE